MEVLEGNNLPSLKQGEMMIKFCDKNDIKIFSDVKPSVCARTVLPDMTKEEKKDIEKKPFLNKRKVTYFIHYEDEIYQIFVERGYKYDGASIPFGFRWILGGKGNPEFLVPSCVHDKMCENKHLVNYDRHLSSLIFKELLLSCGCSQIKAEIMFLAVDNFQKLIKGWKK